MGDPDLAKRVQDLPGQLFNMIYPFTFTAIPELRSISKDYKPPSLLAVNKTSRKLFAKSYYHGHGTVFAYSEDEPKDGLIRWLHSLPQHHRRMLAEVKVVSNLTLIDNNLDKTDAAVYCRCHMRPFLEHWYTILNRNKLRSIMRAFHLEIIFDQPQWADPSDPEEEALFVRIPLDAPRVTPQEDMRVQRFLIL